MNAVEKQKERRQKARRAELRHRVLESRRQATRQASTPQLQQNELEMPKISKTILVYEMVRNGYTDLDIKEATGLSWEEIKRLKAGGKREYQEIIDKHLKEMYWKVYQKGYEAGEEENGKPSEKDKTDWE